MPLISIVTPIYNEEEAVALFYQELIKELNKTSFQYEIIFINDGSTDKTETILEIIQKTSSQVRIIQLSRNFGHQAALCAGLEAAHGDYIISMDGDGQHPPSLLPEMIRLAESGYEIVLTQRIDVDTKPSFKKWSSHLFYRIINKISDTHTIDGGADFRLLSRKVLDNLLAMPEYHRFLRGMVSWLGFSTIILPFTPEKRIAGESKYSFKKMLRLASDAIFSFSMTPLYLGLSAGAVFIVLAIIEAIYVLSFWVRGDQASLAPGWSSLMFMLLIIGAALMVILGFIGVYIGYIFQEVKHRPVFVIQKTIPENADSDSKTNQTC